MAIQKGAQAPNFRLKSKGAEGLVDVELSEQLKLGPVVLLFVPGAFTSVCTAELCDVSSGMAQYSGLGARVFGVSVDSAFCQAAWAEKFHIEIPLLSDFKHEVTKAYDVVLDDLAGMGPASARAVFVVGQDGTVRYAEQTPTPKDLPNFEAVIAALSTL